MAKSNFPKTLFVKTTVEDGMRLFFAGNDVNELGIEIGERADIAMYELKATGKADGVVSHDLKPKR